jgi:hypothetical protein
MHAGFWESANEPQNIVCRLLGTLTLEGLSWHHLQYLAGFDRLGHEVMFVEHFGWARGGWSLGFAGLIRTTWGVLEQNFAWLSTATLRLITAGSVTT